MEDIFKVLLVVGVLIVGLVRQFKKEAEKNAKSKPIMQMPDADMDSDTSPFPADKESTYGGYIPEGPKTPQPAGQTRAGSAKTSKQQPHTTRSSKAASAGFNHIPPPPTDNSLLQSPEEPSEFVIQSAEEARRAIIWSEILQRKY